MIPKIGDIFILTEINDWSAAWCNKRHIICDIRDNIIVSKLLDQVILPSGTIKEVGYTNYYDRRDFLNKRITIIQNKKRDHFPAWW